MAAMQENKARIAKKALELFIQYGIRSVSMDDIAGRLGISKKTIYASYKDKNELVLAVVGAVLTKNCDECDASKNIAKNAIHEAFLIINQTAEIFKRMNPLLIFDMKKYHPAAYKIFMQYKSDYLYKAIKTNIQWGIQDGLYREDFDVEVCTRFRVESILIPFLPDFFTKVDTSMQQIHEEMFYLFLYGMVTRKGYHLITKYKKDRLNK